MTIRHEIKALVAKYASELKTQVDAVHAVICDETKPGEKPNLWAWLTDHRPNRTNVSVIANKGGR